MESKRVQFLRYDKQKKSCKDCFHDCVCPHLRDDDAEKCGAYITDVAPVVHAEWDDYCRCTNCGKEALCDEKPDPYVKGLNALFYVNSDYCPHCGAKMDGKGNDE